MRKKKEFFIIIRIYWKLFPDVDEDTRDLMLSTYVHDDNDNNSS